MADESFLLVSLEEDKAKKLAQVLSNDTARKILDYLSGKEYATESEVSKDLDIPLSTVHYNMNLLLESNLVNDEHFSYSEKGKKIIHYELSNKYVIIAPKSMSGLKDRLKKFLPVVLLSGAASVLLRYYPIFISRVQPQQFMVEEQADAARMLAAPVNETLSGTMPAVTPADMAVWFFLGNLFVIAILFAWEFIKKR